MKFKYIKGTEKDFDGAPEWVTIKVKFQDMFYGFIDGKLYYIDELGNVNISTLNTEDFKRDCSIIAQREPITESQSWFDKGELPPIGEEVFLIRKDKPEAYFGKIIAFNGDEVWIDKVGVKNYKEYLFQPLKTKEQKEKEELRDDLASLKLTDFDVHVGILSSKLYDMGWRKVDK